MSAEREGRKTPDAELAPPYERAVQELLFALNASESPWVSADDRAAARRWAVEASLRARQASLTALQEDEDEEEIDLWVPPHRQHRPPERNDYRLGPLERPFPSAYPLSRSSRDVT